MKKLLHWMTQKKNVFPLTEYNCDAPSPGCENSKAKGWVLKAKPTRFQHWQQNETVISNKTTALNISKHPKTTYANIQEETNYKCHA